MREQPKEEPKKLKFKIFFRDPTLKRLDEILVETLEEGEGLDEIKLLLEIIDVIFGEGMVLYKIEFLEGFK